jgi:hypothetical protein
LQRFAPSVKHSNSSTRIMVAVVNSPIGQMHPAKS